MELILIWGLFGVVSAFAAGWKGRNPVGWFLLGLLIGPFALLLLLFAPSLKATPKYQNAGADAERRCPFCAEVIQRAAIVCKHCGRDLPMAPHQIFCPGCGADITYMPSECPNCGRKFVYRDRSKDPGDIDAKRAAFAASGGIPVAKGKP